MNSRDSHHKKSNQLKNMHTGSHLKPGTAAIPSKKPPVPQYFLEYTQKKYHHNHHHNKQNKLSKESNQTSMWVEGEKSSKGKSIALARPSLLKTSKSKMQDNRQIKKGKKDPYNCDKNSKGRKNQYKQYKKPKSTVEPECSESIRRIRRTEWNIQIQDNFKATLGFDLNCRQKIKRRRVKKYQSTDKSEIGFNLCMSSQTLPKTPTQEMAEFKEKTEQIQMETQSQTIAQIALKENQQYRLDINNILQNQPKIPWVKRAIVMNWMMQTLTDFGSKRQTFAIAIRLLDHYLALSSPIPLEELQILAVTSMYIANKLEDHIFGIKDICQFTANDSNEILQYELKMVMKLKWKLNPPTASMWANRLSIQWDQYIDKYSMHCELVQTHMKKLKFWSQDTESYYNYRQLMQYIDFSILQINTLRYHCRDLAASFMYIILTIRLQLYTKEEILQKFSSSSTYLISTNEFNMYFNEFLNTSFGFHLRDLLPAVQYCSTFLILPVCYKLPEVVEEEEKQELTYSQFCSYQTYNENNMVCLRQRDRTYE